MIENQSVKVPLAQLVLSEQNVRRGPRTGISELAHSILNQGLLQSLSVVKGAGTRGGRATYEVVAGGRRWDALQRLMKSRKISGGYEVPCVLIDRERAVEASLTENTERQAMNPADEFLAFDRLIKQGKSVEDVAAAFGVAALVVKRRLKLANVAPELLERFRAGELDLEALMAFAVSDNPEQQMRVWAALPTHARWPDAIRHALTEQELSSNDRLVKIVGIKSYEKAGGAIRTDLFSDDNLRYLQDVVLLRQLAQAKLDRKAQELKDEEGVAWAEARLALDYATRNNFGRIETIRNKPNAKQAVQLEKLSEELSKLEARADESEECDEAIRDVSDRIEAIEQMLQRPDPRAVRLAGILLTIDPSGRVEVIRGVVRPEDKKALRALQATSASGEAKPGEESKASSGISTTLHLNLTAHLTAGLQVRLAASPGIALRALTAALWDLTTSGLRSDLLTFTGTQPVLESQGLAVETSPARTALTAARSEWLAALRDVEDPFVWLCERSEEEVLRLLAHCTASYADAVAAEAPGKRARAIARAVGLDMRDFWQPTTEAFLKRVPRSVILEALRECDATLDFAAFERAKKAELMALAEPILVRSKWLPALLRASEVAGR